MLNSGAGADFNILKVMVNGHRDHRIVGRLNFLYGYTGECGQFNVEFYYAPRHTIWTNCIRTFYVSRVVSDSVSTCLMNTLLLAFALCDIS